MLPFCSHSDWSHSRTSGLLSGFVCLSTFELRFSSQISVASIFSGHTERSRVNQLTDIPHMHDPGVVRPCIQFANLGPWRRALRDLGYLVVHRLASPRPHSRLSAWTRGALARGRYGAFPRCRRLMSIVCLPRSCCTCLRVRLHDDCRDRRRPSSPATMASLRGLLHPDATAPAPFFSRGSRPADCTFSVSTSADFVRTAWGVDDISGRFSSSARTELAHSAFQEWGVHDSDADIVMDIAAVAIVAIPTCTSALLGHEPLLRAIASLLNLSRSALPPCPLPSRSGDLR